MLAQSAALEDLLHARWSQALATQEFMTRGITLDHLQAALEPARVRSLQRLMQALLREALVEAQWQPYQRTGRVYQLADQSQIRFDHLVPGGMGSWDVRGQVVLQRAGQGEALVRWPSELLSVMSQSFAEQPSAEVLARLAQELDDSLMNDTLCLAYHEHWSRQLSVRFGEGGLLSGLRYMQKKGNPSLLLEQWGTLGHPWHPNYKTKLGPSVAQVIRYSPEFAARLEMRLYALHRNHCHVEAMVETGEYWLWWSQHFPKAADQLRDYLTRQGLDNADYLPLPVHPWHAAETLSREFAYEIAHHRLVKTDIVAFCAAPTMSFRTVLPHASRTAPMVKLPVALRLTSGHRVVSPRSVCMGPRVSALLLTILERETYIASHLDIVPERLGVHFVPDATDDKRAHHLSVLYRDNPCSRLGHGETAIPVGSLFATDEHQRPLLRQWVQLATGADDATAMLDFFERYIGIAVPALLGIYLQYGVAFEAHQQNSFMVMDTDGEPTRMLIRDFGDIRIHRASLHAKGLDLALHDPAMTLFDDEIYVRDKLLHTAFMCHLGELVLLCARHWQVPEEPLWQRLGDTVVQCFADVQAHVEPQRWQQERYALLEADWPAKALLRMCFIENKSDIIGRLTNPLRSLVEADAHA